jgi:hypothetical protein
MTKLKVCPSHVKIYEHLVSLAKKTPDNKITVKYYGLSDALQISYPMIAKCMVDLAKFGCIKLLKQNRGRHSEGTEYKVDTQLKAVKHVVKKEKRYTIRWNKIEIKFEKVSR